MFQDSKSASCDETARLRRVAWLREYTPEAYGTLSGSYVRRGVSTVA